MSAHAIGLRVEPPTLRGGPVVRSTHAALAGPPSLPEGATIPFCGDLQSMMYQATIANRSAQEKAAEGTVHAADATRDQEMRAAKEAEERAAAAADDSSFWGDVVRVASTVATVAGAAALCASAVMSGGATAPVVIALLGTLLTAGSGEIAKATGSSDVGKACMWGGLAMSVGAGGYQALAKEAAKQGELTVAQQVARYALPITRGIEGGARVTQGAATMAQKKYEGDVVDARADALAARIAAKEAQTQVDGVVDALQELEASVRRAINTVMATGNELQKTRGELIARIGRSVVA
jgi:hypothetical protein